MERELLLMRHAKSSWDSDALRDHDRPLSARGRRNAPRMGDWLRERGVIPERLVGSPARRARETMERLCQALGAEPDVVVWDDRLYLADREALLTVIAETPVEVRSLMLIGHNPGLDGLLLHLCAEPLPLTVSGRLLTTAAVARIALPGCWQTLSAGCGRLIELARPKELDAP